MTVPCLSRLAVGLAAAGLALPALCAGPTGESLSTSFAPVAADDRGTAPPTGFVAVLEDEVHELPQRRIRWDTYWKLCWDAYPEASGYELQVITTGGTSGQLKRTDVPCLRIQVAADENPQTEGLRDGATLLALQAGQLALRVRAQLADGRRTEWSPRYGVGMPTR